MLNAILIATGDELTDGDILNTTGPAIARQLAERNIAILKHIIVPDDQNTIQQVIEDALKEADLVFTTGGLGPTSDDRTRFALANAIDKELVFNEANWQSIVDRLSAYKLHVHPDNRQQALFPEDAEILPNPNGTAAGCCVTYGEKQVFMLPGPPNECLPMFRDHVLPKLSISQQYKLHWLLIGASEGEIAATIDAALKDINCQTGYRADYPYLEIKVWVNNPEDLMQCEKIAEPLVKNYLVSKENIPASITLREKIASENIEYKIYDAVTGGILQSLLDMPNTHTKVEFLSSAEQADIIMTGLENFWQGLPAPGHSEIHLQFNSFTATRKVFYRGDSIRQFAAEWVCWQLISGDF